MKRGPYAKVAARNADLLERIRALKAKQGYRRVWVKLRYVNGLVVNHKRVYSVMKAAAWWSGSAAASAASLAMTTSCLHDADTPRDRMANRPHARPQPQAAALAPSGATEPTTRQSACRPHQRANSASRSCGADLFSFQLVQ